MINEIRSRIISQRTIIRQQIERLENYLKLCEEIEALINQIGSEGSGQIVTFHAYITSAIEEIKLCLNSLKKAEESLIRVELNIW